MQNIEMLKDKMAKKSISVCDLADLLGVDASTIYRKFQKNGENFSIGEANQIVKALDLSEKEAMSIFFASFVA
ncbi:MAG: helix-turn-helix domain-containing protein [Clostridia bacterium]|nr:helix-turn-helix domain-containing protein [Clostridia bacterium]